MNIIYNGIEYNISEKYSNKDMTGWNLSNRKDMNGIVISNSCLSNEILDASVLPSDLSGTTFIDCNLDNVIVPVGNLVLGGSQRKFKCQNDGEDWIVDAIQKKAIEPVNKKLFLNLGISIDPKDIPAIKQDQAITVKKINEKSDVAAAQAAQAGI